MSLLQYATVDSVVQKILQLGLNTLLLVGECNAFLASGSDLTIVCMRKTACVVTVVDPLSPRQTRRQFALSDSFGSVGALPVAFPLIPQHV
jgi:hypothetical protein